MQIAGQEIDPSTSVDEIITQLKPHRYFSREKTYTPSGKHSGKFLRILNDLANHKTEADYIKSYKAICDFALLPQEKAPDKEVLVNDLLMVAKSQRETARALNVDLKYKAAMQSLATCQSALKCAQSNANYDGVSRASDLLYTLIGEMLPCLQGKISEQEIQKLRTQREECKEANYWAHTSCNYAPDNPSAWIVEQKEVGFSCNEPIGTTFLHQCVGIVVRVPVTKKTAVAHATYNVTPTALDEIFKRMPNHGSTPLEVRLIGACEAPSESNHESIAFVRAVHQSNALVLFNVLSHLRRRNVNILSADILKENQPAAFVFIPQTGELRFEVPALPSPNAGLSYAHSTLDKGRNLHLAFDLTVAHQRAPILVDKAVKHLLLQSALSEPSLRTQLGDLSNLLAIVHSGEMLEVAYKKELGTLIDYFQETCDQNNIPTQWRRTAVSHLENMPVFVGENAQLGNNKIRQLIDQAFVRIKNSARAGETKLAFDMPELEHFNAPNPYSLIEAEFGKGFQAKIAVSTPSTTHRAPD